MNVLLTGASGTVGTEILSQLASMDEINITVFDIKNSRTQKVFSEYKGLINIRYGDISNPQDVAAIEDVFDVAIHLAAIIPPLADENPQLAQKVNVTGTKNLIQLLERTSPEAFLLFSSSVATYGDRIQHPYIVVTDQLNARRDDVYAQTKIECEKLIKQSRLNWSIFRLTAIMKNHKMSKLMFHMPLSTMMEICTPTDTARAFVRAILHQDELSGRVFNLGGGERCCISYRGFLEESFRIVGLGKLNFPDHVFAECNFHCGIFKDGDDLENILHFRNDTIETYFEDQKRTLSPFIRLLSSVFRFAIKQSLLLQSEPLKAYKSRNKSEMSLFFFPEKSKIRVVHR